MASTFRQRLLLVLLLLPCFGAGPSKPGTDVVVGGGVGRYSVFGMCAPRTTLPAQVISVRDVPLYGRASHQFRNHVRVVVEGGHSEGKITSTTPEFALSGTPLPANPALENGSPVRRTQLAMRVGGSWRYGGLEAGPIRMWRQTGVDRDRYTETAISLEGWAGHPDYGYLWGRYLAGPPVGITLQDERRPPICGGLGVRVDAFRFEAGVGSAGLSVDGDVRLGRHLLIGVNSNFGDTNRWATLLTMGLRFDTPP